MIDAIKFTRGAIAKKDYVPELTHFHIKDGRITGFNGDMALSSPINLDVTARPKATTFAKAVATAEDAMSIHMTKAGRLSIKSGKFRALVDCVPEEAGIVAPPTPEGDPVDVGPEFMRAIRAIQRFQGVDASRPWAMGLMFHEQSVYATNNVMFAQYWHGHTFPFPMNLPAMAVKELLRINKDPVSVLATQGSVTFFFEDDRWLQTRLIADDWPDNALALLDAKQFNYSEPPEGFFEGLAALKAFIDKDERVFFRNGVMCTSASDEIGASFEVDGLPDDACFSYKVLTLLEGMEKVDFSNAPNVCGFTQGNMRGIFLGLRTNENN